MCKTRILLRMSGEKRMRKLKHSGSFHFHTLTTKGSSAVLSTSPCGTLRSTTSPSQSGSSPTPSSSGAPLRRQSRRGESKLRIATHGASSMNVLPAGATTSVHGKGPPASGINYKKQQQFASQIACHLFVLVTHVGTRRATTAV